ncbi:hypothetical protein M8J77_024618 [Diaphorina citri]|nr:hypothetical protein M8J77_024618 [Diaphorina citri]
MGHPVFRQILKAISLKRAIGLLEKREIWDVSTLISWISDHPPNQDSFFEVARHTAILLLLCSGRRVLDLTLLLSSRDGFQDLGDRAVFWPAFGSKTDTSGHRQSGPSLHLAVTSAASKFHDLVQEENRSVRNMVLAEIEENQMDRPSEQ